MKLQLPDVTLCAITGVHYDLTLRAMKLCMEQCDFGAAFLITDKPVDSPVVNVVAPPEWAFNYADIACRRLASLTPTSHNLIVQWDGYIVDPEAWTDWFLQYDYIGALWPWERKDFKMGNSGFCLRSKRLLETLSKWDLPPVGTWVDDDFICKTIRTELNEQLGFRFAPDEVADRFAYERGTPGQPTFGFHGPYNFWRHTSDADMQNVIAKMDSYAVISPHFMELMHHYWRTNNWSMFDLMKTRRQEFT